MLISDLNYVESINAADADVKGAGGAKFNTLIKKYVDINERIKIDVNKTLVGVSAVFGNLATAEAGSDSLGPNSLSETNSFTQSVYRLGSQSYSSSISSTNGDRFPSL